MLSNHSGCLVITRSHYLHRRHTPREERGKVQMELPTVNNLRSAALVTFFGLWRCWLAGAVWITGNSHQEEKRIAQRQCPQQQRIKSTKRSYFRIAKLLQCYQANTRSKSICTKCFSKDIAHRITHLKRTIREDILFGRKMFEAQLLEAATLLKGSNKMRWVSLQSTLIPHLSLETHPNKTWLP